ncbi:MAG TPA: type IV secretion system DNA-binding domain-containing protein [Parcubacteria group bacterium]|jgi:energy-coupling factor transporter ATP-binding protein EcfA2|nr:type IV secretion system DNA-binding domain-containing protein [Parcubacteria group bacterium]
MIDTNSITYFAETDARNKKVKFGIKAKDRLKHMYVIGKTGMGKSTLLENMAIQDIQNGNGMAFIDPHGGTAEKLLEYVPEHRIKDVIYFAPFDIDYPISFNVMEDIGAEKRHLVVSGLMSAFKKLFGEESFSDRMQYILQNTILALLEYPGATMLGINKMLADKEYRNKVIANITDPSVKSYWVKEYAGYTERFAAEAIPAIQNKIGQFTSNPLIRNIMGQEKSSFDFRDVMDKGKIIIINLSKGKVGEGNANLIGSMIITKIYLAAMSRADRGESDLAKLPNFYLYVDEFQSFANKSFADILSEARKYKLNLTIAHQYIEQMEEEVRDAVFGNVGTMITFRVGAFDAEVLEKEFAPTFMATDLVNLGFAQIYLKLMIDGVSSQPFSATTLPGIARPEFTFKDQVLESSREQFARKREDVEKGISDWHDSTTIKDSQKNNSNGGNNIERRENKIVREDRPMPEVKKSLPPVADDIKVPDENKIALMKAAEELKKRQSQIENVQAENKPKLSLDDLRKEKELSMQVGKKNPSKENLSSLKDALAGVLNKKTEEKINSEKEVSKDYVVKNESKPTDTVSTPPKKVTEVPENVLREILKMDDGK